MESALTGLEYLINVYKEGTGCGPKVENGSIVALMRKTPSIKSTKFNCRVPPSLSPGLVLFQKNGYAVMGTALRLPPRAIQV
ncbi:hypothetical protein V6N13_114459 [Hibiscus sabdariffa]